MLLRHWLSGRARKVNNRNNRHRGSSAIEQNIVLLETRVLLSSSNPTTVDLETLQRLAGPGITRAEVGTAAAYDPNLDTRTPEERVNFVGPVSAPPYPLADTFNLSSRPSATKTIYLDFNGQTVSGTLWNSQSNGNQPFTLTAYSQDGDNTTFNDAELESIQRIWQRVAEDFAPFDVNVTTLEPPVADLINAGGGDTRWGVRAIIGSTFAPYASAGGVAYLTSFSWNTDTPALVFEDNLGNGNEKFVAEATSHEVGHSLGLSHDGRSNPVEEYYQGQGPQSNQANPNVGWAPIMGVGYNRNLVQFSRGEYSNPSNTEDDLTIITTPQIGTQFGDFNNGFGYRVDDFANTTGAAAVIAGTNGGGLTTVNTSGVIERNTDVDLFRINASAGTITLNINGTLRTINGGANDSNLDILAELLDSNGNVVASSNPANELFANISYIATAGTYYLRIDGVGLGNAATTGYTDYGSLGQYTITGSYTPAATTSVVDELTDQALAAIATDGTYLRSVTGIVVGFNTTMSVVGGTTGANSVTNVANWTLTRNGQNVTNQITSITTSGSGLTFAATANFSAPLAPGAYVLTLNQNIQDALGALLDGDGNGTAGGNYVNNFNLLGPDTVANTTVTGDQNAPDIASDSLGNSVVVWTGPDASGTGIYARRFDPTGAPIGSDFLVNVGATTNNQAAPVVAMAADGRFVIAWQSNTGATNGTDIFFQRYDANGVAQGGITRANNRATGGGGIALEQLRPAIAMSNDGTFVIAWESEWSAGDIDWDIAYNVFSATGVAQFADDQNPSGAFTGRTERNAAVARSATTGAFVIVWNVATGANFNTEFQRYNAAATGIGGTVVVSTDNTSSGNNSPSVGMDNAGNFVVAWSQGGVDSAGTAILASRYSDTGALLAGNIVVNTTTAGSQLNADVSVTGNGLFNVAWQGPDSNADGIFVQRFTAAGVRIGNEILSYVNQTGAQQLPRITTTGNGDVIWAWQGAAADGNGNGISRQVLRLSTGPSSQTFNGTSGADTFEIIINGTNGVYSITLNGLPVGTGNITAGGIDTIDGLGNTDIVNIGVTGTSNDNVEFITDVNGTRVRVAVPGGFHELRFVSVEAASLNLGSGNDVATVTGTFPLTLLMGAGEDRVTLVNGASVANINFGTASGFDELDYSSWSSVVSANLITGIATGVTGTVTGATRVNGGSNNDIFTANSLVNIALLGGAGNDTYNLNVSTGAGNIQIGDVAGTDTLNFSTTVGFGVNVNLDLTSTQSLGTSLATLSLIDPTPSIENVVGTALADQFMGNALNNTFTGGAGDDLYLFNLSGGNQGSDTINEAGGGIDTVSFAIGSLASGVTLNLGLATQQTVHGNLNLTLTGNLENLVGSNANDTLTGNILANIITGGLGSDTLTGDAGNDTYIWNNSIVPVAPENDIVNEAGGGVDTLDFSLVAAAGITVDLSNAISQNVFTNLNLNLSASNTVENIIGTIFADTLTGNSLNNVITGLNGNDTLNGLGGNDTYVFNADGQLGTDTLNGNNGDGIDTLDFGLTQAQAVTINLGQTGVQVVAGGNLSLNITDATLIENIIGGGGNDTFTGNASNNTITGGAGNDTYVYDLDFDQGFDSLVELNTVGAGLDTLDFSSTSALVNINVDLRSTLAGRFIAPTLSLTLNNNMSFENLTGGEGNDTLIGNNSNNIVQGNGGNDLLYGFQGTDALTGGLGNDTYFYDIDLQENTDTISDAGGADTLNFLNSTTLGIVGLNLGSNAAQVVNANLMLTIAVGTVLENVFGTSVADNVTGNSVDNLFDLGGGDDIAVGGLGADTFIGGAGNDTLTGGDGNDTYRFDADLVLGTDTITEIAGGPGGIDTLDFSATSAAISVDLRSVVVQVVRAGFLSIALNATNSFENLIGGGGNDILIGNQVANNIQGTGGNDSIYGFQGNDTLSGGQGNDTYLYATTSQLGTDTLDETGGGIDMLNFTGSALGVTVNLSQATVQVVNANLSLILGSGTTFENVTGGNGNDVITGNTLANSLVGGNGNDTLNGAAGNDILNGGLNDDTLIGGADNDSYIFDTDGAQGIDTLDESGGGIDTLDFSAQTTTTFGATVDLSNAALQVVNGNLSITLGSGTTFENINGTSGNDTFTSNSADNTLTGRAGDDTYVWDLDTAQGSDTLNEALGGIDTLDFSQSTAAARVDLRLSGIQTVNATSLQLRTQTAIGIERIIGGFGNDILIGNNADNIIRGGDGNDTIYGGPGSDVLVGGAGNDTLFGDAGNDVLVGGAGIDTLRGGTESDLLVGAGLTFENDMAALVVVQNKWRAVDTYLNRANAVQAGTNAIDAGSIVNDGVIDTLEGGAGVGDAQLDMFFVEAADNLLDWDNVSELRVVN